MSDIMSAIYDGWEYHTTGTEKDVARLRKTGFIVIYNKPHITVVGHIELDADGLARDGSTILWATNWKASLPLTTAARNLLRKALNRMPGRSR